ncbi:hypothetical protein Aeh1ORF070c [Aeromonas phage Aeh1]|uniref:Uncharacterized protein n=1 Tax=Aeromonas phage Aeh1 TaxID=2880362 RepID=Q76Z16_9CAUD|nr:hypothetical protein Aeh1p075 [Aeromonas phage Aeh1]AAQ17730.1 hypothetical protein Aeh1ORF070c [Aeromonas phage Aeh1]
MLIEDITRSIMSRRVGEVAKLLKKEGIKFERYRDCCVVNLECMSYWVTPNLFGYTITNNCSQRHVRFTTIKSVISHMKTIVELDKDL